MSKKTLSLSSKKIVLFNSNTALNKTIAWNIYKKRFNAMAHELVKS